MVHFEAQLSSKMKGGPECVGIPGTIDNDIVGTDYTIGFDTACNTALDAIRRIRAIPSSSSSLYFLVETMGRHAGFIAADVGLAGGAEYIITPEFPIPIQDLAKKISSPKRKKQSLIIVVAEGDNPGQRLSYDGTAFAPAYARIRISRLHFGSH